LIGAARAAGARVALDARDEALAQGVAARPDVVKVNAEEAGGLLGRAVATMEDAGAAARAIRSCLAPDGAAIVTRGADGAMIATPEGSVLLGRLYARGSYPVGSGDAFLAGLVVCLERGEDWAAATCLAL